MTLSISADAVDVADRPLAPAVEVRAAYRTFEKDTAPVRALRGADLHVARGEFVAVMGPSGCGKSTLLNVIAGLDLPDEGEVVIAGESLAGMDENRLAIMRRKHVGIVFQFFNLLEGMTVLENVVMPAVIAGRKRKSAESRARDLLDLLGIGDKAKQAPGVLSGGQRQRLAIARALANEPTLVLADEPTGALDSEGGEEVLELFRRLHQGGQTILMVTHDQPVADAASRIVRMKDGRVVDDGVTARPEHRLAGNRWAGRATERRRGSDHQRPPSHRRVVKRVMAGALLWARSEIRDGWRSLIVVGVLVAVVTGSVLALAAGASRAGSAPDRFAESTDLAELIVFIGGKAPAELVDEIAADPRVERVAVGTVAKIGPGVAGPESNAIIGQDDALGGYGRPFLVSGRYPEQGSTDEILLSERGALREGIAVGDRVPLSALECLECEAVSIGDAVVVGIIRLSEDLVDDPGGQLVVLAGPTLAGGRWQRAEQPGTILSLHIADGVDRAALTADLSTTVGALGNASDQEVDIESVERAATLQRDALLLLAAVAAAAGAVVVAQAVSRHLQRRPSDAAVLEAVGLARRQRIVAALTSVLPAVLAGAVAGVCPRWWRSARPFHSGRSDEPRRSRDSASMPALLALGGLAAVVLAGMATVFAAMRWARTTPSPTPGWAQRRRHDHRAPPAAPRCRHGRPLRPRCRARHPTSPGRPDAGDRCPHRRPRGRRHRRAHQPRSAGGHPSAVRAAVGLRRLQHRRRARVDRCARPPATRGCRAPTSPAPASSTRRDPMASDPGQGDRHRRRGRADLARDALGPPAGRRRGDRRRRRHDGRPRGGDR